MTKTGIPARLAKPFFQPLLSEYPWWPGRIRRLFSQVAFHLLDGRLRRQHADFRPAVPAMQTVLENAGNGAGERAPVVFAVGNAPYIRRFAPQLADSLARHAPGVPLWLHFIGPEREQAAAIAQDIRRRNPALPFTMTSEPTPVDEFEIKQRHRYCQCVRFVHARTILQQQRRPVLCIDIDTTFRGDPSAWHDSLRRSADVHFFMTPERDCGRRVKAGCTWFNPTPSTLAFLERAGNRMFLHIQHGWFIEKLDQRCLCLTAREMSDMLRVDALPQGFVSFEEDTPAIIFTAKGVRKRRLPGSAQGKMPDNMRA